MSPTTKTFGTISVKLTELEKQRIIKLAEQRKELANKNKQSIEDLLNNPMTSSLVKKKNGSWSVKLIMEYLNLSRNTVKKYMKELGEL